MARHSAKITCLALMGLLLVPLGCTSVDSKFGAYSKPAHAYLPTQEARQCTKSSQCVQVDINCSDCCPGGGAVNAKYLDVFNLKKKYACEHRARSESKNRECVCVMARSVCLKGLCTWDYKGPDPSAL